MLQRREGIVDCDGSICGTSKGVTRRRLECHLRHGSVTAPRRCWLVEAAAPRREGGRHGVGTSRVRGWTSPPPPPGFDWRRSGAEARAQSTSEEAEPRTPRWGAHGSRSEGAEPLCITVRLQRNGIADGVALKRQCDRGAPHFLPKGLQPAAKSGECHRGVNGTW